MTTRRSRHDLGAAIHLRERHTSTWSYPLHPPRLTASRSLSIISISPVLLTLQMSSCHRLETDAETSKLRLSRNRSRWQTAVVAPSRRSMTMRGPQVRLHLLLPIRTLQIAAQANGVSTTGSASLTYQCSPQSIESRWIASKMAALRRSDSMLGYAENSSKRRLAGSVILTSFVLMALAIAGCGDEEDSNDKRAPTSPSTSSDSPVTIPSDNPESFEVIAP